MSTLSAMLFALLFFSLVFITIELLLRKYSEGVLLYISIIVLIIAIIINMFLKTEIDNIIPAIDVYQNKTTLQYTVKNGIVIDSIVVYKNDNKLPTNNN